MRYRNYYCTPKFSDGEKTYYGDVQGAPEIPMIEAATLDDFERLFHQAVDDYLDCQGAARPKTNWGLIITLVAIVAVIVAAIASCPKKDQHVSVLADNVSYALHSGQSSNKNDANVLGELLGTALAKPLLNSYLTVNDYIIFSVGHLTYQGEDRVVSFGAFGHIFTMSKEEMKRKMQLNKQ